MNHPSLSLALTPPLYARLRDIAAKTGFDLDEMVDNWAHFSSTHKQLQVWVGAFSDQEQLRAGGQSEVFIVAFSQPHVLSALVHDPQSIVSAPLVRGIGQGVRVASTEAVYRLLFEAFRLPPAKPTPLLQTFQEQTANLPQSTEIERLVVQRVGQEIFREGLLARWEGRCVLCGLDMPALLRASHIKPWAACESDEERLDVNNGLLLAAHLDAAFDKGLITLDVDGRVLASSSLTPTTRKILGLARPLAAPELRPEHQIYLAWHREHVFDSHLNTRPTAAGF